MRVAITSEVECELCYGGDRVASNADLFCRSAAFEFNSFGLAQISNLRQIGAVSRRFPV